MEDLPTIQYRALHSVYADMSLARPGAIVVMCADGKDPCGIGATVEEAREHAHSILVRRGGYKGDAFTIGGEARRVVLADRQLAKARTDWRIRRDGDGFVAVHVPTGRSKVFPTREHAQATVAAQVTYPDLVF